MLRGGLASLGRSVYTCLCVTRPQLATQTQLLQGWRWHHTTASLSSLDKDVRGKKSLLRLSDQRIDLGRSAPVTAPEVTTPDDVATRQSDHHVAIIPDLSTPGMLVNGVRFDELPILHLKCSPNNTIATLTDHSGNKYYGRTSCGKEGFRNAKKSSTVAAQATGMSIGYTAKRKGVDYVRVAVKGIGAGRLPALKGLHMAGVQVVSITDRTPIFSNGPRPRKVRRL